MTRNVDWAKPAASDLKRLEKATALRIVREVDDFARTGQGDVRKLEGRPNEYRLRVGDYRVRFTLEGGTMLVLHVLHRREAYR